MCQRGTAALFVSHDPVDAGRLADRVAVLQRADESAPPPARTRLSLSRDHVFLYSERD